VTGNAHRREGAPACPRPGGVRLSAVTLCLMLASSAVAARADAPEDTLAAYAVHIHQTPMQSWGPGAGIYLGQGAFITAAHVAGHTWWTRPKVVSNGEAFPTRTLREGSFDGIDVTVLGVEEKLLPLRLRLRRMTLCAKPPMPGQDVVTVVPGAIVHSRILAPERLPANLRQFNTVIRDVANTGDSGSGVFDAQLRCLLGIMSRKISVARRDAVGSRQGVKDIAKYFVPAATIAAFLPPELNL